MLGLRTTLPRAEHGCYGQYTGSYSPDIALAAVRPNPEACAGDGIRRLTRSGFLEELAIRTKVASWLDENKDNFPITVERLQAVLGDEHVQGIQVDAVLTALSPTFHKLQARLVRLLRRPVSDLHPIEALVHKLQSNQALQNLAHRGEFVPPRSLKNVRGTCLEQPLVWNVRYGSKADNLFVTEPRPLHPTQQAKC